MNRPQQYCAQPGCGVLVARGRCRAHAVQHEHGRGNFDVRRWYRLERWRRLRLSVLTAACYECAICHRVERRLAVDHIVKHAGDPGRFWARENLQAICAPCHVQKTTRGE